MVGRIAIDKSVFDGRKSRERIQGAALRTKSVGPGGSCKVRNDCGVLID